jgi:phosphoglycerol transferase MdoB-like AlkP superfamily enzyme
LDFAGLVAIAITLVDFRLTGILGARLDWNVLALGNSPKMMWQMAKPYVPLVFVAICVLVVLYSGAVWLLQRRQKLSRTQGMKASYAALTYLGATFVLLGLLGARTANSDKALGQATVKLAATSPLWKLISGRTPSSEQFFETAKALGVTFDPGVGPSPDLPPRELNVLLVFMESSYNKHLSLFSGSEETQPLLSQFKERMELFPNFFSSFASSIHARFATFTSLYPVCDYNLFTTERVPVKSLFEVFHDQGYSCSMFYSSFADFTGFRDFLKNRGLAEMYDADSMPGQRSTERVSWGLREEETLGAMRARLQKYAADKQRFFLTYVPAAPHYPYEGIPPRFRRFQPSGSGDYKSFYLNELLYMDWVLASLIDELKESGLLEKTLVVITDDHGEMLGGKGDPIGHGWLLTPELANAPLIIMDPEKPGYRINRAVGSQVDLLPTLLDRLRIPLPAEQLYQGRSMDCPASLPQRIAYLNSFQQYGLIAGDHLIFGDREKRQGKVATGTAYSITNEGAKSSFLAEEKPSSIPASISRFDQFQEVLLRNYSRYAHSNPANQRRIGPDAGQVARHQ